MTDHPVVDWLSGRKVKLRDEQLSRRVERLSHIVVSRMTRGLLRGQNKREFTFSSTEKRSGEIHSFFEQMGIVIWSARNTGRLLFSNRN